MKYREIFFAAALAVTPVASVASVLELSQGQMRTLVSQQQVLSAQTIVAGATSTFGGSVMEIRGFLSDGKMTYRLLLQRDNGQVVEVLIDGQDGRQVAPSSAIGQVVSVVARTSNGPATTGASSNGSRNSNSNNASSNGNERRSENSRSSRSSSSNNGNRGNSGSRGNSNGNNGKGRGN